MADKLRGAESELVNSGSKPNRLGLSRVSNAAKLIAALALAACGDKPNTPNPTEIAGVQTYALNGNPDAPTYLPPSINGKWGDINDEGAGEAAFQEAKDPQGNRIQGRVDLTYERLDLLQPTGGLLKRSALQIDDGNNGAVTVTVRGAQPVAESDPINEEGYAVIQQGLGGKTDGLVAHSDNVTKIRSNGQLRWGLNNNDPQAVWLNRSSKPGKVRVVAKVSPMTTEDVWLVRTDTQDWYQTLKLDITAALAVNNGKSNRQKLIDAGLLDPTSGDGVHESSAPETQDGRFKITSGDKGTVLRYDDVTLSYDGNTKLWSQNPNNPTTTSWFVSDSAEVTTSGGRKVIMITINDTDPNIGNGIVSVIALVPQGNGTFLQVPVSLNPDAPVPDDDKDGLTNDKDPIPQLADDAITINGQNPTGAVKNIVNGVGDSLMQGYDKAILDGSDSLIHYTNAMGAPQIANRVITLRPGEKIMVAHGSANGTNPSPSFTVKAPDGYELKTTPWSTYKLDGSRTGATKITYQMLNQMPNAPVINDVLQGQMLPQKDYGRVVGAVLATEGSITEYVVGIDPPPMNNPDGGVADMSKPDMVTPPDMGGGDMAQIPDAGVDGGEDGGGMIGQMPDMARVDMVQNPDLAELPDMTVLPDMTQLPDMSVGPDMTQLPDMTTLPDQSQLPDLSTNPDLTTMPKGPDLTNPSMPDMGMAQSPDLAPAGMEDDHEHGDGCGCNLGGSEKDKSPAGALMIGGLAVAALMRRRQKALVDAANKRVMDMWTRK